MKVKRIIISREDLEKLDPKQTVIVILGEKSIAPNVYRIVTNNFSNRQEAYRYACENEIKKTKYVKPEYTVNVSVKLLSLKNALKEFDTLDKNLYVLEGWKIVE